MIKKLLVSFLVSFVFSAYAVDKSKNTVNLSEVDKQAMELGRKVLKVKEALKNPDKKESFEAIKSLGHDSRYYVLVRGWLTQHIHMTESYKGTSKYKSSKDYKKKIDARQLALQKMLRAIDLE